MLFRDYTYHKEEIVRINQLNYYGLIAQPQRCMQSMELPLELSETLFYTASKLTYGLIIITLCKFQL
ncbi:hypothetical protein Y032_0179g748 [Ancylostoma ceylanicum]|uniref:Uncharacterized protein n=1 Tax=Ancylostoma ceylanicum TaxID=53326 RepID=A0A016STR4_9BILA|nr:hypothetical protein Y032_0179g748 [Ancylostoma ceylanicum]